MNYIMNNKKEISVGLSALISIYSLNVSAEEIKYISFDDVLNLDYSKADSKIYYGKGIDQFGELRLPKSGNAEQRFPVVMLIHGGCYLDSYNSDHFRGLASEISNLGFATWMIEYSRINDKKIGYPNTFHDVGMAADYIRELAKKYPIDLSGVTTLGHSAGGQLALYVASRNNIKEDSDLYKPDPIKVKSVISLAGITDLTTYSMEDGFCNQSINKLLGGSPKEIPKIYQETSPINNIPSESEIYLIHGSDDSVVKYKYSEALHESAMKNGANSKLVEIKNAEHYELIYPKGDSWVELSDILKNSKNFHL